MWATSREIQTTIGSPTEIGELKYQKEPQICSIQWVNLDHQWEPLESLEMMNYHDDVEIPLVTYSTHKLIWRFPKSWGTPCFIHFDRNFHEINDPAIGDPPF
jgi:hypothetical protein